jgi:hypothetical protein
MHYVRACRAGLLRYATNRVYKRCLARPDFRPRETFWNQPVPLQDLGV